MIYIDTFLVLFQIIALQSFAEEAHHDECIVLNKISNNGNDDELDDSFSKDFEEKDTVLTHSHHHHSHSGGQNMPQTVAAIAWMVILGDGLHNFSDGLAIGTAFANSITGGFSTSIAVFCHELPHEIGDFAVLLRAGMKPKQAIIYNCISSILCFFGMIVGVTIGNIGQASLWIFIVVGGMFLYIALVDMLPEMTSVDTTQGEHPFCHLLFQISGMLVGASIMLIIAIYESDLKNVFET
ncbi:hypothetical protein KUTeg_014975 [Tegillarca granosa]|uniref:Uncharacterized protein n=1 Tax=Tegillarca granosa TaxID=220873 RepID=A0ABQ9ENR6_TEGGR|nr:hypothetical protein KUTeg_014975 [Tegillarca granosa]